MQRLLLSACLSLLSATYAFAQPPPADFLALVEVAEGLSRPLYLTHAGDSRLFIVEQTGAIRIYKNGAVLPTPYLDISSLVICCGERGLLGLAFHPDYPTNGYFYVNYTDAAGDTVVARYQVSSTNADVADPASAQTVLTQAQPFSNHNGGHMAFGPNGYLHIGFGDGGGGGDPQDNAQDLGTWLGKLLRIDIDGDDFPGNDNRNYAIPPANPFVGVTGDDEIWAYGLRNPWRYSFDRLSGDLFIGDVGQGNWEEINRQAASSAGGENYGWDVLEGTHCFEDVPSGSCNDFLNGGSTLPVFEYSHALGCSIAGGYVYRGRSRAGIYGGYLYGDFCSGRLWRINPDGSGNELLFDTGFNISSFGEDQAGRLYVLDLIGGTVHQIIPYTFADVPPSGFGWRPIETITDSGITNGCSVNPPIYCPNQATPREQMAVFLLRAAEGGGYVPPPCVGVFGDVPCPSPFARWIEELAARGITVGCGGGNYCPDNPVTRAQMAVFLLRAVEGAGYNPPACVGAFNDVPCPGAFADWIEELAARGITAGCGGGNFCPAAATTRAQMAVFLTRTFVLAPL